MVKRKLLKKEFVIKKKTILTIIRAITVLTFSSMVTTQTVFSGGDGSSENPFQIATILDLAELAAASASIPTRPPVCLVST